MSCSWSAAGRGRRAGGHGGRNHVAGLVPRAAARRGRAAAGERREPGRARRVLAGLGRRVPAGTARPRAVAAPLGHRRRARRRGGLGAAARYAARRVRPGGARSWWRPARSPCCASRGSPRGRPGGRTPAGGGCCCRAASLALSCYNGYFGAGSGVLTLALLLLTTEPRSPAANALKNMVVGAATITSAVLFAVLTRVDWARGRAAGARPVRRQPGRPLGGPPPAAGPAALAGRADRPGPGVRLWFDPAGVGYGIAPDVIRQLTTPSAKMAGVEFDYVVVGAGAAGCVVAGRLASGDRRGRACCCSSTAAGRATRCCTCPKGFYYTLRGDRYLYRYRHQPGRPAGRHEVWLRGRVLGGVAAVNGMIWMRGAAGRLGRAGRARQPRLVVGGGAARLPGDGGPQPRRERDPRRGRAARRLGRRPGDEVTAAILASAVSYGWRHVADANASDAERIGFTPSTISRGRRTTSYDAYVRPALARRPGPAGPRRSRRHGGGLTVVTRTRAARLLFDGRRVAGVAAHRRAGTATRRDGPPRGDPLRGLRGDAAAARASGIGRPDLLRAHGIALGPSRRTSASASSSSAASPCR